jgi:hypothetical protein
LGGWFEAFIPQFLLPAGFTQFLLCWNTLRGIGGIFTFLVIVIFARIYPERFIAPSDAFGLWSSVLIWAGFLILTVAIVGITHWELQDKMTEALRSTELWEQTMSTIREFKSELDYKVE